MAPSCWGAEEQGARGGEAGPAGGALPHRRLLPLRSPGSRSLSRRSRHFANSTPAGGGRSSAPCRPLRVGGAAGSGVAAARVSGRCRGTGHPPAEAGAEAEPRQPRAAAPPGPSPAAAPRSAAPPSPPRSHGCAAAAPLPARLRRGHPPRGPWRAPPSPRARRPSTCRS